MTLSLFDSIDLPGVKTKKLRRAGEIARVPPMAAIANAIFNATGVRISKLPLSLENVLRGLMDAEKREKILRRNTLDSCRGKFQTYPFDFDSTVQSLRNYLTPS